MILRVKPSIELRFVVAPKVSLVLCVIIMIILLYTLVAVLPVKTGNGIEVYSV